jgi:hypothetical protein
MQPFRIKNRGVCFIASILFGLVFFNSSYGADHTVTYPDTIPCVLWARGCTPTSTSMVLGYWDNYDPDGNTYLGSGRLIDYWRDLTLYSDGTGPIRNVPNILDELRIAMGTDVEGGTYTNKIGPGIRAVVNTTNGYCYGSTQYVGTGTNDHCWGTITNEIDNNRPFVWSVGILNQDGHSLAAWGYTDDKYVITYNTWYCTGRDDWYYAKYDNGQNSDYQYVDTVVPNCWQDSNQLGLYYPAGSESLTGGQTVTICLRQWGTLIDNVNLYYSTDGGGSWFLIGSGLGSSEGLNYYAWTVPNISFSRVRVKAYGYGSTTYIAGDGTKNNLAITPTGVLSVTPSDGLSSSGNQGGPFSPSSKNYTLQNTGESSINWAASKGQVWITLSSTSGTLAAGANTTVTVSINSNANSLVAGSYNDTIAFTNTTNGNGNTTRAVSLAVVSVSKPDLIVSSLTGPTTPVVPGQMISLSEATKNQGSVATTVDTVTKFYWSKDATYDGSDVLLGQRTVGPLAAGGISGPVSTSVTVPTSAVSGTFYHILAIADADNAVAETNETNNKKLLPVRISP